MSGAHHGLLANFMAAYLSLLQKLVPGKPEVFVEQPKKAVAVSWTLNEKNGYVKEYRVTYIKEDNSSDTQTLAIKKMEIQFHLKAGKSYELQV